MNIYKYDLAVTDEQVLLLPNGAKVLTVQVQNQEPKLWALVDPTQPAVGRKFLTFGTTVLNSDLLAYIGTYQLYGDRLVFHVFEATA